MMLSAELKTKKRAGVSFPLVSLLSEHSYLCGDFYSLRILKEWAVKTKISLVQILPLNDLGSGRSPYSSISAFALDPVYISFQMLKIPHKKTEFPESGLDIKKIKKEKLHILEKYFLSIFDDLLRAELDRFISSHPFMKIYTCFLLQKDLRGGTHWEKWNLQYSENLFLESMSKYSEKIYYYVFLQKTAFEQLSRIKQEFKAAGVYLEGDMPILTSDDSADVWGRQNLFDRSFHAGAPPDYFNTEGQSWGFPIIRWEEMKKENYSWWKERLEYLEHFYHFYRIDHVLGMYRIWAIPKDATSPKFGHFHPQIGASRKEFNEVRLFPEDFEKLGLIYEHKEDKYIFYWDFFKTPGYQALDEDIKRRLFPLCEIHLKEDEAKWRRYGEDILSFMMKSSSMLPCAEDLGAVPKFVRDSIFENEIIGLDIIRWTRSFEDGSYIKPADYRKLAVSCLSVHDTSTAMGWWKECDPEMKKMLKKVFGLVKEETKSGADIKTEKKAEIEKEETEEDLSVINEAMLKFALAAASLFSVHMLQDYLYRGKISKKIHVLTEPEKHRINVPGTPEDKNWGYVFPFLAEELLSENELNSKISEMISASGRV
ncbi:MAG TPA: 4-alpha-glucanotransferase [Leptospiraceae bacterium]|nr:4-alpha-glucanotransferase [Leptospiraceae bacterium]HMZ57440.1 4-alpha-glucanotransferase [Leptospiraceae bacterium]HNF24564.1 4-alpha-glucanotransferase [Leptospiraceae bacterium]HNM04763.1 4-alpha-glucanotransferase [Leptospiraceae bacterium]HNN05455.1 4-alpha-glucanotransferase [Leptospiraceae bacterium]